MPHLFKRLAARLVLSAMALGSVALMPAHAAAPPAGLNLRAQASATYTLSTAPVSETAYSNIAQLQIAVVPGLTLQGEAWLARAPGMRATVPYRLFNPGNVGLTVNLNTANVSSGCTGYTDNQDLANLRVVVDANGNGVADPAELASPAAAQLPAGGSVALLVLGDVPLTAAPGAGACLQLKADAPAYSLSQTAYTFVAMADNPVIQLLKVGSAAQALRLGGTDTARYTITASNLGTRPATPVSTAATGEPLTLDGQPMVPALLLRDAIPAGAVYRSGTLQASHANGLRLFRRAGDAPFAYRSTDPGPQAIEVAVAYPFTLEPGASMSMGFEVSALDSAGAVISNLAQLHHSGLAGASAPGIASTVVAQSNLATVPVAGQRLGLAHWVVDRKIHTTTSTVGSQVSTVPDGTVTYTLGLRVRNDGDAALFNLQLRHPLQGNALLGNYTSASVPGAGQYTVVPGSLQLTGLPNSATVVPLNTAFTGTGAQDGLLAAGLNGSTLPVGAEFTLWYAVRVNVTGRANVSVASQVSGQAAVHQQSQTADAADLSTSGSDPDPDADHNPGNNSTPTPIVLPDVTAIQNLAASLSVRKSAGQPVRRSLGLYDLSYTVVVKNTGTTDIDNLRVIDNLTCTFNTQDPTLNIDSWSVVSPATAQVGSLPASPDFNGGAGSTCNTTVQNSTDPTVLPLNPYAMLNQGGTLRSGQSETYTFTVRVRQADPTKRSQLSNKAWLAAMQSNSLLNADVLAASATSVSSLLVDPQGIVYDSVTRQPVAGARVTLTRETCDAGTVPDLTADQVFDGDNAKYSYSGKSISMTTGSDGQYQFFWKVPPVADICTYSFSVTPPAGHTASRLLPAETSTYGGCGFVSDNETQPIGSQPTTWYSRVRTGYKTGNRPDDCPVLHNHIPLDPGNLGTTLLLSKQANKSQAELGDFVDYQLKLKNLAGVSVSRIAFDDVLPPGFAYVPGSSLVGSTRVADPVYKTDSQTHRSSLSDDLGTLELLDQTELTLRYRLRIGVGAMSDSDAVNSAIATARSTAAPMPLQSNNAQARVRVSGGVFSTLGFAVGKVWADCNANGLQDNDTEPGIPGVRLYLENGVSVITDQFGRWSLYGLKPVTHALRMDLNTLPAGATPVLLDNRQAGQAHSRFLDVKNGELVRADFAVQGCEDPELQSGIERRQQQFAKAVEQQLQALVSARLPADNRIAIVTDTRGMPASGVVAGGVMAPGMAMTQPEGQTLPLIRMPGGMQQGLGATASAASMGVPLSAAAGAPLQVAAVGQRPP
ncbi:MAG: hypothetical protein ACKOWC_08955, partial [Limnohabitans sp.]